MGYIEVLPGVKMPRYLAYFCMILAGFSLPVSAARADSASTRPAGILVAVLPFEALASMDQAWVGRAIGEGLVSSIGNQRGMSAVTISAPNAANADAALSAGKSAQADFVVFGQVQRVNDQLRISGKVLSTQTGQSVGDLAFDGQLNDLFIIEDALASRVARLVATKAMVTPAVAVPGFEIRGPTLPTPSRYFDGNISAELAVQPQFQSETDRYNYHPTPFYYYGYGYPYWGYGPFPLGGWRLYGSPVTGLSEW